MVVYTNADFISLNEENLTYSVLVVDLEGKAVLPAVNDLIPVDCKDAGCAVLAVGESADFAVLDKNILKDPTASVEAVYLKGRDTSKSRFPFFHI